ncbi:FecR family protein [Mucilaginibacter sp.]|uniref:FecR family protein n=1 Tax=Mucilaginibacter sp. TaxID=1882438 RepID=UPI003D14B0A7
MDKHLLKNLLKKYLQGKASKAEVQIIEEWLSTIKNDDNGNFDQDLIDENLQFVKSRIDGHIAAPPVVVLRKNKQWLSVAASLILLLSASALVWNFYFKKTGAGPLTQQAVIERHIANGWVYIKTPKGKNYNINLPDGSMITLNASSKLRFPVKFINHKRPIYLDEGEALFNVAKDKTSPFTVYTNKFATTALGTAFNIRSYSKEHKISISLIHGKIRVDDLHPAKLTEASKILLPHQQIVLNKQSGTIVKADFKDETPITAWTNKVLIFQDASMDEVINAIENHYNVTITNRNNHKNWSYTGTFKNEPLADVLKIVCLTEGLTFNINKNNITLN